MLKYAKIAKYPYVSLHLRTGNIGRRHELLRTVERTSRE